MGNHSSSRREDGGHPSIVPPPTPKKILSFQFTSKSSKKDLADVLVDTSNLPWRCGMCGLENQAELEKCSMCACVRPTLATRLMSSSFDPLGSPKSTISKQSGNSGSEVGFDAHIGALAVEEEGEDAPDEPVGDSAESPLRAPRPTNGKSIPKMRSSRRMRTLVISKEENHALVFIKPAVSHLSEVRDLMEEHFNQYKCAMTSEGRLMASEIDERGTIDIHYAAMASNAMTLDPPNRELNESTREQFKLNYEIDYSQAAVITLGQLLQARPDLASKDIDQAWNEGGNKIKLSSGVYVGRLKNLEDDETLLPLQRPLLVVNGFYAQMRFEYIKPGVWVDYFTVEWKEKDLSWHDFRKFVIGSTDPAKAEKSSLRSKCLRNWESLGMTEKPSVQNNCVHASAGPIEAMRERATWINMSLEKDPFAQAMLIEGVPFSLIESWSKNEPVTIKGLTKSSFDMFEDVDSGKVIESAIAMTALAGLRKGGE